MKTAVEWLLFELSKVGYLPNGIPDEIHKQAKEIEEDYKYEAYKEGLFNGITAYVTNDEKLALEQLYNQTLKKY